MGPSVVVEFDDSRHELPCPYYAYGAFHPVEPFLLDYAVDPFGHGVVSRIVVLRHAYGRVYFLQTSDVFVAAILHSTVGMVRQPFKSEMGDLGYPHVKGGHGARGGQALGQRPPDYLMCEGVGQQVQVGYALVCVYIGDVGHPQLVGGRQLHPLGQVLVFAVVMVGVGRVPAPLGLEHQTVVVHQTVESVTASHLAGIHVLEHYEQLVGPYAGSLGADGFYRSHYFRLGQLPPPALLGADAVITLAALAKQSAETSQALAGMSLAEGVYCLAPVFFNRSRP